MFTLVVIEASGKRDALKRTLRACGLGQVEVVATLGHICANPASLNPLCIDRNFCETDYQIRPEKAKIASDIKRLAALSHRVLLATDDDAEGDVIARDVYERCLDESAKSRAERVRLRALSVVEVQRAIASASPVDPLMACQGDARRILDRLIGSLSSEKGAVGRVSSSALIGLSSMTPVLGMNTYTCPSADRKGVWVATEPVYSLDDLRAGEHLSDCTLSCGWEQTDRLSSKVMSYNDILLNVSLETKMAMREINDSLQRLYERGALTYLRSKDNAISHEALSRLTAMSEVNGVKFSANVFPDVLTRKAGDLRYAHEAPNPMIIDVPLNRDPDLLGRDERVLNLVAQNLLYCGIICQQQKPNAFDLAGLPPEAQHLNWRRVIYDKSSFLWDRPAQTAGFVRWTPEQSLLHFMSEQGLGRPSTVLGHIEGLLRSDRNLLTDDLALTERGKAWAAHASALFGHKIISTPIESLIAASYTEPQKIVRDALRLCGFAESGFGGLVEPASPDVDEDMTHDW